MISPTVMIKYSCLFNYTAIADNSLQQVALGQQLIASYIACSFATAMFGLDLTIKVAARGSVTLAAVYGIQDA